MEASEDLVLSVRCRYSLCGYFAAGADVDMLNINYKQHLRESHAVQHPKVEEGEVKGL
jgi:hypothetical protein